MNDGVCNAHYPRAIDSSVLMAVPVQLNVKLDGQTELQQIETELGVKFVKSLCLCGKPSDSSKHCTHSMTLTDHLESDYLESDLSGHANLLIVPSHDAFKIMKHYFDS